MEHTLHFVNNHAGWDLALKQCVDPARLDPSRPPLVIVPGYGMNAFIFGYHPSGASLEETLCAAGFEVWSVNLRNQEPSRCKGGSTLYSFEDVSLRDLPIAVDFALAHTRTRADEVTLLGCSLGGTFVFTYLGLHPRPPVRAVVVLGSPLRWVHVDPVLSAVFACPALVGMVPVVYTRKLARLALPLLRVFPRLAEIYIHPAITDLSQADEMVRTVEDPNRRLNREIAEWFKGRDLYVAGSNVTEAFRGNRLPILSVVANADGIVPPDTARFPLEASAAEVRDELVVGDEVHQYAHADLYLSRHTHAHFFNPLATWLRDNAS
jgi:pimeloyl-ACP methyl ester carboxylesterase